jgi:Immunity protein 17
MKGYSYPIAMVGFLIGLLGIWFWLMNHGLPFRSYAKLALLVSGWIAVGILCLLAAIFNWDWFFKDGRAPQWLDKQLGRGGARICYFLLGAGMAYFGHYGAKILLLMGLLEKIRQE